MRAKIPGSLALLAMLACADLYEADPAYTARADSSAAGYTVDDLPANADGAARPGLGGIPAPTAGPPAPAVKTPTPTPSIETAARIGPEKRESPRVEARVVEPTTPGPVATDSAGASPAATRDDVTLPPHLTPAEVDSVVVNTFLAFDPRARTIWLDLIAGYDGSNGSLNFDGGSHGTLTLRVPLGWRVEARFANQDGELAHSATVIREVDPIPLIAPPAAFPGAFTLSLEGGLQQGERDTMIFSANAPGSYMIICGVPGHAQGGMWVRLEVSARFGHPDFAGGQARRR